jgi:polyisoprenoid-binding protein YceI
MMLSKVRGEFQDFAIHLDLDEEHPEAATVEARIKTASVNTRDGLRDGHLRSRDFFKSDEYPEMVFKSSRVVRTGKTKATLHGELTIRDVTKPVVLDVIYFGSSTSRPGTTNAGFRAGAKINREDWGLTWNAAVETGGWLVGKDITINIEAEFTKQDETT